jgi:hypothetical protein
LGRYSWYSLLGNRMTCDYWEDIPDIIMIFYWDIWGWYWVFFWNLPTLVINDIVILRVIIFQIWCTQILPSMIEQLSTLLIAHRWTLNIHSNQWMSNFIL